MPIVFRHFPATAHEARDLREDRVPYPRVLDYTVRTYAHGRIETLLPLNESIFNLPFESQIQELNKKSSVESKNCIVISGVKSTREVLDAADLHKFSSSQHSQLCLHTLPVE